MSLILRRWTSVGKTRHQIAVRVFDNFSLNGKSANDIEGLCRTIFDRAFYENDDVRVVHSQTFCDVKPLPFLNINFLLPLNYLVNNNRLS